MNNIIQLSHEGCWRNMAIPLKILAEVSRTVQSDQELGCARHGLWEMGQKDTDSHVKNMEQVLREPYWRYAKSFSKGWR